MKFLQILALALTTGVCSFGFLSCSASGDTGDCGYSAGYDIPKPGEGAQIEFFRITAEQTKDGRHCGMSYQRVKVVSAEIKGQVLTVKEGYDQTFYIAPVGFEPEKDLITISSGTKYVSDPKSIRRDKDHVNIKLNPAP